MCSVLFEPLICCLTGAYAYVYYKLYLCECFRSRLNPLAQRATTVPMEWIICRARLSNIRRGAQKQIQTLGCCSWEFISWITRRRQKTGTLASSEHTHNVMDVRALWSQGTDCWCKTLSIIYFTKLIILCFYHFYLALVIDLLFVICICKIIRQWIETRNYYQKWL
jgi:hypothetical protein